MQPSYIELFKKGELKERIEKLYRMIRECCLCPRNCTVNRLEGERGICKTGELPVVSSYNLHFGEEDPLVGEGGSGTIFFTHCNLLCNFCQNYEISHLGEGEEASLPVLAKMMLALQERGCHNINFVTPTHVVPQIVASLPLAIEGGLKVPLVYNSGGYDSVDTLKLLEGVFDIYMPDFKFVSREVAASLCQAKDYPEIAKKAIKEMHRQVGDLVTDERGIAQKGLLIRHLVLPEGMAGTREVMRFLSREISPRTYVNVMAQYRPCGKAIHYPPLNRSLTRTEYNQAIEIALEEGITMLDKINVHLDYRLI